MENDTTPAIGASVVLLSLDSTLLKGSVTDLEGNFRIENILPANYLLKITYMGFAARYKKIIIFDSVILSPVILKTSARNLKEVEVVAKVPIATLNGDTTSYNSKAFKTNKDANAEDLISKMPGVTTVDGKIQAQGEDVKQVLVDGQVFFGDDAASVLKNLPAEIIEKVQVFDKKSDQAQLSGVDDGNTSKAINIVTKMQFRNGTFGKIYGGYGYEDKYKAGAVINRFKNKQRITFLLMSNNINEQNFSSEDLLGVTASSSGRSSQRGKGGSRSPQYGGSPNSEDNFLVNIKNGITQTHAGGINYSDVWGRKTTVNGSYFFNATNNTAGSNLFRQYVVGVNNGLNYSENSSAIGNNYNHRANLRIETKLDSSSILIIQPKFSLQMNDGKSSFTGVNSNSETLISNIANSFGSDLSALSIALPVQFRHAFVKRGRSIFVNLNPTYTNSDGNSSLQTFNQYYTDSLFTDTIDQQSLFVKSGYSALGSVFYTEPLSKTSFLSFNYSGTYTHAESEKNTFNKDSVNNSFTSRDSLLSNVFNNQYLSNSGGITYRYNAKKFNLSLGASYQQAELRKQQIFPGSYSTGRIFESVLPSAFIRYRFTPKKNIRLFYRASNAPPAIDQLQDVLNNNNSLQLSIGNSELKQTFQNNLNVRYSGVNIEKASSLFVLLGGTYVDDYISNSTIIASQDTTVYNDIFLAKGSQITRPVNLNNYYALRTFINYSFALKRLKSNLNINASGNYNNVPALINNRINFSNTTNTSLGLVLSSNVSENFDFMLSSSPGYNYVTNSLQRNLNSTYYTQTSRVKVTYSPVKWLQLQAEYTNQYYNGLTGDFNQNISLLNGAVAYKFLKAQNAELRLFVFDILNQNNSVQRTTTETYIEDSQTNILQRYFMLSFTYNFKKFFEGKGSKED